MLIIKIILLAVIYCVNASILYQIVIKVYGKSILQEDKFIAGAIATFWPISGIVVIGIVVGKTIFKFIEKRL